MDVKRVFREIGLNFVILSLVLLIYLSLRENFSLYEAFFRLFYENLNQTIGFLLVAVWTAGCAQFISLLVAQHEPGIYRIGRVGGVVYVWFAISAGTIDSTLNAFTHGKQNGLFDLILLSTFYSISAFLFQLFMAEHVILIVCTTLLIEFVNNRE